LARYFFASIFELWGKKFISCEKSHEKSCLATKIITKIIYNFTKKTNEKHRNSDKYSRYNLTRSRRNGMPEKGEPA